MAESKRVERRMSPGIVERHALGCSGGGRGRPRCTCSPTYRVRVRQGDGGGDGGATRTFGTYAQAVAWRDEARDVLRAGGAVARRTAPPFGQAAREFLARARAGKAFSRAGRPFSVNTVDGYESVLRVHVLSYEVRAGVSMETLRADLVDTRTIQALVNSASTPSVARKAEAAVGAVLRDLYGRDMLEAIPARPILPAPPRAREKIVSPVETDRLLTAAAADDEQTGRSLMAPLVALLVGSGCRISEALSVTWGPGGLDLGRSTGTLTIARETTKTEAGARTLGLDRETAAVLRRHRRAIAGADGAFVFSDERGQRLTRDGRVRSGLRRVARSVGLDDVTPHVLRHAHASWLSEAGEPATAIATRLGHTDAGFTMRRYVHADRARVAEPPARLTAYRAAERRRQKKKR